MNTPHLLNEVAAQLDGHPDIELNMPPAALITIIGYIQLALRHPQIPGETSEKVAMTFIREAQAMFPKDSPAHQLIEMGFDPAHDC